MTVQPDRRQRLEPRLLTLAQRAGLMPAAAGRAWRIAPAKHARLGRDLGRRLASTRHKLRTAEQRSARWRGGKSPSR